MQITLIPALSIFLQFLAAFLALRLIPMTGNRKAWICISAAILLMAFRRCITFFQLIQGKVHYPSDFAGLGVEWVTLAISILMVAGIYWIAPLFRAIRRAAEVLRESEEKYRALFEKSRDAIYVTDGRGRLVDVNESFLDLLGYSRQEMTGMDARKLYVDFSERAKLRDGLNRDGYVRDHEIALRKKDGARMDCLLTTVMRRAKDGTALGYQGIVRDISGRRKMERALQESNEILNAILAAAPVGICLVRNRTIEWANKTMHGMVGYEPGSLLHKNALVLYPDPLEYERVGKEIYSDREEPRGVRVDTRWARKDGTLFDCLLQACPLDPSDPHGGEIVAVLDVTERKQAEESLRESELRYRTLFDAAHDAILLLSSEGICTDCNPAAERLFGSSRAEIVGARPFDFSPERQPDGHDSRERSNQWIRLVMDAGVSERFEWLFLTPEARLLEAEVSLGGVSLGEKAEMLAFVRNIGKQKEMHRQLQREKEHLASVLDGSPVASGMINRLGEVTLWNRACELLSGIPRQKVLGLPLNLKPLFGGKNLPVLASMLLSMDEGQILDRFGKRGIKLYDPFLGAIESKGYIVAEGGKRRSLRIIATRIRDSSGKMTGVFQCAEDITGEEELQSKLLHAQKMEAVGRLAGGIAHDFNNALMAILGYTDLVMKQLGPRTPLFKRVEEIKKAGERASSLTRQLLAFSRKQMFRPKILDLNLVITDLEAMLRRLIGEDIDLATALDPEPGLVKIDPAQAEQIITNLVINARDAMPRGGRILVETANVVLDETYALSHVDVRPGHYLMLAVSDTGMGMDAETLSHIFEPFFTTKEEGKGTGLGLSSVYGIVQQNEGHISVYSEIGRGTVFKIHLPRVEGKGDAVQPVREADLPTRGSETLLLVEDDDMVREVVAESLKTSGYTVLEASHPEEALRVFQEHDGPVHLLISDVVMPGMSGPDLARQITNAGPDTKILFISGYTHRSVGLGSELDPGAAFLQKPFSPDALLHKVRAVLDERAS